MVAVSGAASVRFVCDVFPYLSEDEGGPHVQDCDGTIATAEAPGRERQSPLRHPAQPHSRLRTERR